VERDWKLKGNNMKTFTLEDNEAAFIIRVVGQLPTESGAYPLLQKLQQQVALVTPPLEPQE